MDCDFNPQQQIVKKIKRHDIKVTYYKSIIPKEDITKEKSINSGDAVGISVGIVFIFIGMILGILWPSNPSQKIYLHRLVFL